MSSAAARTVLVTGSTGNTGSATVSALAKSYPNITVRALVRDSKKAADKFKDLKVEVIEGDSEKGGDALNKAFAGVDVAIIILPMGPTRLPINSNYVAAVKASGVKRVVVLSVPTPINPEQKSRLTREYTHVEAAWKSSGVTYTFARFPMFAENEFGNVKPIKTTNAFYYPVKPDAKYCYIAVADIGTALAALANSIEKYENAILRFTGPDLVTPNELAKIYTEVLGREIKFVSVPAEAAIAAMKGAGFPEDAAAGITEIWNTIDNGDELLTTVSGDYHRVTGSTGTSIKQFITQIAGAFK